MNEVPVARRRWFRRRGVVAGVLVIALPAIALGWWLFSPLLLNKTVVEDFPRAAAAEVPDGSTIAEVEAAMVKAEAEGSIATDTMPEADPVKVLDGQFNGADSFHKGTGGAGVYTLADGSQILRFDEIDITNGPDLHVILSPVASADSRDDVMAGGYVDLGSLKGNRGSQNYDIPPGVDLTSGEWTIVIYCQPFHVIFATAELAAP